MSGPCGAAPLVTLIGETVLSFEESVRTYAGPGAQYCRDRRGGDETTGSVSRPLDDGRRRGIRIQRRNTRRSGKVSSAVAAIRGVRQAALSLLPGACRLRMVGEVWGSRLLVLVHGFENCAEPYVHAVGQE